MTVNNRALALADELENEPDEVTLINSASVIRHLVSSNNGLMDEVARLNQALTWEQNRSGRIGTHGPGCHTWGPSHYECLLRVNQELLEALKIAEEKLVELEHAVGGGDDEIYVEGAILTVRAAIAKAQP